MNILSLWFYETIVNRMKLGSIVVLLLNIFLGMMIPQESLTQISSFQVGINSHFILDANNGGDSLIYVMTGKVERAADNSLSFIGGFGAIDPLGNVARSFRMRASNGFDIQFFGNKVFCNADGSFYLIMHISRNGVSHGNVLVALDKDFNITKVINNQTLGQNVNSFFRVEDFVLNKRFVWLSVFKPAIRSNVLLFLEHDIASDEYKYEEYKNTNSLYNMIVQDAVSIDSSTYLICGEAIGNEIERYSLTKFNNTTKQNKIYTFNFDPIHMTTDPKNNLIIMGSTSEGEIVITKYTKDLNLIWSRQVGFSVKRSDYSFSNKSITTDTEGNIFINLRESVEELNLGTKILQLDTNGEVIYHKLLLDATQADIKAIRVYDEHLMLLTEKRNSTYLRRMPLSASVVDVETIDVCTEIGEFTAEIMETNYNFEFLSTVPILQDLNITISPDTWTTFPYSEPFAGPFVDFEATPDEFCPGDTLKFNYSSIYPFGISEWSVMNSKDTFNQISKTPRDVVMDREEKYRIQHKLFFAGCEYIDTMEIELKISDVDFFPDRDTICDSEIKTLEIPENVASNIVWFNGSTASSIDISDEGQYFVSYKDSIGCSKTENLEMIKLFAPEVDLGSDIVLCQDSVYNITLTNPQNASVLWNDGSESLIKNIRSEGIYSVTLSNDCGEDFDDIEVKSKDCSPIFFYSNVFVPGSDGPNSQFVIRGENISKVKLQFYDRWGNLVFFQENLDIEDISWDGRFNGRFLSSGVYSFVLSYTETFSGISKTLLGNTTLLR